MLIELKTRPYKDAELDTIMIFTEDIMWLKDIRKIKSNIGSKTEIVLRFERIDESNVIYVQETVEEIKKIIEAEKNKKTKKGG